MLAVGLGQRMDEVEVESSVRLPGLKDRVLARERESSSRIASERPEERSTRSPSSPRSP
jgi:hypothetical protein